MKISLCMIVKDEEDSLHRCLSSVKDAIDEIIIVDTGSIDKTVETAMKFTDKIYNFKWIQDFSAARNFSFSKATCEYIMWMDADDVMEPLELEKLIKLKQRKEDDVDMFMFKYNASFDEEGKPTYTYYRERLLKRSSNFLWQDPVHEVIVPRGKIENVDISISHKPSKKHEIDRNLKIYEKVKKEKKLSARQQFYYSRELMFNNMDKKAIKEFKKFLDMKDGWIVNKIEACNNLARLLIKKGVPEEALLYLYQSFIYGSPTSESCCLIGNAFNDMGRVSDAIFWFELALKIKPEVSGGAFVNLDYSGFFPAISLCQCYYKIGEVDKSIEYNELAASFRPLSMSVASNREFFNGLDKIKSM